MFYDEKGNLVLNRWFNDRFPYDPEMITEYVPAKQVQVIKKNLKRGVPYPQCSPMYDVSREAVAFIMVN